MAAERQPGMKDGDPDWHKLPMPTRRIIDRFNQSPAEQQAKVLAQLGRKDRGDTAEAVAGDLRKWIKAIGAERSSSRPAAEYDRGPSL